MVQTENQSKNGITIKHHKSKEVYAWNPSIGARKCNKDFEIDECLKKWACIVSLIIQKLRVMQYQIHHKLCQLMLLKKKATFKMDFYILYTILLWVCYITCPMFSCALRALFPKCYHPSCVLCLIFSRAPSALCPAWPSTSRVSCFACHCALRASYSHKSCILLYYARLPIRDPRTLSTSIWQSYFSTGEPFWVIYSS